jgi:hypothetical protein
MLLGFWRCLVDGLVCEVMRRARVLLAMRLMTTSGRVTSWIEDLRNTQTVRLRLIVVPASECRIDEVYNAAVWSLMTRKRD